MNQKDKDKLDILITEFRAMHACLYGLTDSDKGDIPEIKEALPKIQKNTAQIRALWAVLGVVGLTGGSAGVAGILGVF